ncbi:MAG: HTTM domain-containing protein, partial [Flavobacteriales bacterium]
MMGIKEKLGTCSQALQRQVHPAPLSVLRILFGLLMAGSMIRLWAKGWVEDLYIRPAMHFSYYGFEWVRSLGDPGMHLLVGFILLCSLFVALGLFYRLAILGFFLSFSYLELIDKAYYLNHYYFISVLAFLLIFLPAHRYFSLDVLRKPSLHTDRIPAWMLWPVRFQVGLVYFYAGVAKLEYDWLFRAEPMRTWLPAHDQLPLIGEMMARTWVAYLFSWFGAIYDLSVPFFLSNRWTRPVAYLFVIAFHVMTAILFPIGVFPWVMILLTLIFFPASFHLRILRSLGDRMQQGGAELLRSFQPRLIWKKVLGGLLLTHFLVQILIPWRFLLYPGELFWNEEGYRFSWRVMLMEKAGKAFFTVKDPESGGEEEVSVSEHLTPFQEKMMAT